MSKNNLNKRAVAASAKQAGALSLFEKAASELEAAAAQHQAVRDEAIAVVTAHNAVANDAAVAAEQSLSAASKIRALVG